MTHPFDLAGKIALVTGASGGLGEHFARTLAASGAKVVLAARRMEKLVALRDELSPLGEHAFAVEMDVTSEPSVNAAFAAIQEHFGAPCDIVVNNSGVARPGWYYDVPEEDWQAEIDTNLTGVWRVAKAATQALIAAKKPGSIINISSITAFQPAMMNTGYAANKAAVDHMTKVMATESARLGIRVNAIAPGYFSTAMNDDYLVSESGEKMRKRVPMRRFGQYKELDGALLLLASDAGSYMTGTTIVVDGGHTVMSL